MPGHEPKFLDNNPGLFLSMRGWNSVSRWRASQGKLRILRNHLSVKCVLKGNPFSAVRIKKKKKTALKGCEGLSLPWGVLLCSLAPKMQGMEERSWFVCHFRKPICDVQCQNWFPNLPDHMEHLLKCRSPEPSLGVPDSVFCVPVWCWVWESNKCSRWFLWFNQWGKH